MNKGFYNMRGGSQFNNSPIDRRNLDMRDRSDLNRSGEYLRQSNAYKRARAINAQNKMLANRKQRTTVQTPGSGGQSPGIGIQQERYREMGAEKEMKQAMRPDMDDTIYDIYKTD